MKKNVKKYQFSRNFDGFWCLKFIQNQLKSKKKMFSTWKKGLSFSGSKSQILHQFLALLRTNQNFVKIDKKPKPAEYF